MTPETNRNQGVPDYLQPLISKSVFRVSAPGGTTFSCRWPDPFILDIIAILAGVKKAAYSYIQSPASHPISGLERIFGLHHASLPPRRPLPPRTGKMIFFSQSRTYLREAVALWRQDNENPRLLDLLGYPVCCSAFFHKVSGPRAARDLVASIYSNTASRQPFPFYINNILNTTGRDRCSSLSQRIHLLPWHPCSYDCAASLSAGRKMFKVLKDLAPELAFDFAKVLAQTFLYSADGSFAVLSGSAVSRREASYSGVRHCFFPFSPSLPGLLGRGNRLVLRNGRIEVFHGNTPLGSSRFRAPLLLDFGRK